ncbi:MAG: hypothetical protein U0X75_20390 [Acidobacteriota bacterium]
MFTTPARRQQFGAKSFAAVLLSLFLLLAWPLWQRLRRPQPRLHKPRTRKSMFVIGTMRG